MRLLIEGGAPLGNADDEGLTPLHLAAYSGKLEARPTLCQKSPPAVVLWQHELLLVPPEISRAAMIAHR